MKTLLLCGAVLCLAFNAQAQNEASGMRGPHHRFYPPGERVGQGAAHSEGIVAIESGMHYWSEEQNAWLSSEPRWQDAGDAFVARKVQHRTRVSAQLNALNAITVTLPSGTVLSSTPVGIALSDSASGAFLVIAGLTNSTGVQIAEDQVLYPNAFQAPGVCADVLLTVGKATLSQDIVFTGKLDPREWGFPLETTRIQVLTEFYSAPEPERVRRPVYTELNEQLRARMAIPDLMDETLGFSEFVLGTGYAFTTPSDLAPEGTTAVVSKEYVQMGDGGRVFLVETVPYAWLAKGFESLGACTPVTGSFKPENTREKAYAALPRPPQVAQAARAASPASKELAATLRKPRGVVIDYLATISGTLSAPIVFSSYTNWVVVGPVYCNSATVIEGGSIFKFPTSANCYLQFNSTVTFKTGRRPIIFTGVDDDGVGDSCAGMPGVGYTGVIDPNGYANPAIKMGQSSLTLDNVRFCYAKRAIQYQGSPAAVTVTANHSQFVKCIRGIDITFSGTGGSSGGVSVNLNNSLMAGVTYPLSFGTLASPVSVGIVQSTVDSGTKLVDGSWSSNPTVRSTNSIFANLSSSSTVTYYGNANGFYNSAQSFGVNQFITNTSPFQAVGAGSYYLTDASGFRNQGTNVLAAWLAADIRKRTTYPPLVVSATTYSTPQVFGRQAQRDTDGLDLGYHYVPIDYAWSGVDIASSCTITNGAAIAMFGAAGGANYGLAIRRSGDLVSRGTADNLNWLLHYNTVQEQPVSAWTRTTTGLLTVQYLGTGLPARSNCRFTAFSNLGLDAPFFNDATNTMALFKFQDCEFYGGKLLAQKPVLVATNCLFERVYTDLKTTSGAFVCLANNLFVGGAFTTGATNQFLRDNVFDKTGITNWNGFNGGTNVYVSGSQTLNPIKAGDIILPSSPAYESGPLGSYYQPTNSALINADSAIWAADVGMYHYAVSTNQMKEGNSRLDAGFHYVATDAGGIPVDSDGDGLADYIEDNGNGVYDTGDLSNLNVADTDGDGLSDAEEYWYGYDPKDAHTGGSIASDADKDYDGDLLSNFAEIHIYGSSPTNAHYFNSTKTDAEYKLTAELGSPDTEVRLEMDFLPNQMLEFRILGAHQATAYDLYFTPDFGTGRKWARYYSASPGQTVITCPDPLTPFAFFSAGPTGDNDGDGLTDGYEVIVSKTRPNVPDSDSDLLKDGWEVEFGLDPTSDSASDGYIGDPDLDNQNNLQEQTARTDPKRHSSLPARPELDISVTDPTGSEGGGDNAEFVFARTGDKSQPLTLYYALGGTAVYGSDYTLNPAPAERKPPYSITIPATSDPNPVQTVPIQVIPIADADPSESSETVILGLEPTSAENYVHVKYPQRATATIRNRRCHTYELNADFALGMMSGLVASGNQIHFKALSEPQFPYINVACSSNELTGLGRNTVVRIDVGTGEIVGEYRTGPATRKLNPSRTTVDQYGNVWVANRDEDGQVGDYKKGSITRIGLIRGGTRCNADGSANQTGQYIKNPTYSTVQDRDGDGLLKTSRGLADILPWTNQRDGRSDVDTFGGVSTAEDEAITEFVRVEDWGTRTIAVDKFNDIWVGGLGDYFTHQKVNGLTAQVVPYSTFRMGIGGCGGYGGVIDKNGVLWSAGRDQGLLRLVPPSSFSENTTWNWKRLLNGGDYGLAVDPVTGKIWHSWLDYAPSGALTRWEPADGNPPQSQLIENHGWRYAQGIVVDLLGNVWVAHAIGDGINHESATHVGHLRTDGTYIGNVELLFEGVQGRGPTGLSVDNGGYIWVTCRDSNNAMRIDPTDGTPINGVHLGKVNFQVDLGDGIGSGHQPPYNVPASPYNYSDMTGFNNNNVVNTGGCPLKGYWCIVEDAQSENALWAVSWDAVIGIGQGFEVYARASDDRVALSNQEFVPAESGAKLAGVRGRFLEVRTALKRNNCSEDPYVENITVCAETSTVRLEKGLEDLAVAEGQSGSLEVVPLGNGPFSYEWFLNGKTIEGAIDSVLAISSADCLDNGQYSVRVTDASGDFIISGPVTVTVIPRAITIPSLGIATPYPAQINVQVTAPDPTAFHDIDVTLTGFSHERPDDLDILLVPPWGPPIILMSDAGGQTSVTGKTLVFTTRSSSQPPDEDAFPAGTLLTYGASNFGENEESFPAAPVGKPQPPSAPGGYSTDLSLLQNEDPRGAWLLYIVDDATGSSGSISGSWCITVAYPQ